MSLKQKIYEHCRELIANKLAALQSQMQDLTASAANETKSSSGDKYETGRAMLHIEQDNLRSQISDLAARQAVLNSIDISKTMQRAATGSLITTNRGSYFLSIALGKLQIEGQAIIALSVQSPLGSKLKGLQSGDSIEMNGSELRIEKLD